MKPNFETSSANGWWTGIDRRTLLKVSAAGITGSALVGTASAKTELDSSADEDDGDESSSDHGNERARMDIGAVPDSIVDVEGTIAPFDDPDTLLYDWFQFYDPDDPKLVPVTAPDHHHLTWDEFATATGRITAKCVEEGTKVRVRVGGLLPGGLYSMWVVVFAEPGYVEGAEDPFVHLIGAAPLGNNDGSEASFRASDSGRGRLTAVDEPATLTADIIDPANEDYRTGDCLLTDEYEVHVLGAYHYDDETHGPEPRPFGVEQFGAIFGSASNECRRRPLPPSVV